MNLAASSGSCSVAAPFRADRCGSHGPSRCRPLAARLGCQYEWPPSIERQVLAAQGHWLLHARCAMASVA
jgi:hypothetical protein